MRLTFGSLIASMQAGRNTFTHTGQLVCIGHISCQLQNNTWLWRVLGSLTATIKGQSYSWQCEIFQEDLARHTESLSPN